MKHFLALFSCAFLALPAFANSEEAASKLNITESEFAVISVQNLSEQQQVFEISGQNYFLEPMAGLIYPCQEYDELWFQLENEQDPIFVPCARNINLK